MCRVCGPLANNNRLLPVLLSLASRQACNLTLLDLSLGFPFLLLLNGNRAQGCLRSASVPVQDPVSQHRPYYKKSPRPKIGAEAAAAPAATVPGHYLGPNRRADGRHRDRRQSILAALRSVQQPASGCFCLFFSSCCCCCCTLNGPQLRWLISCPLIVCSPVACNIALSAARSLCAVSVRRLIVQRLELAADGSSRCGSEHLGEMRECPAAD